MNLSMEARAAAVIGPDVSGERMTSRNGWRRATASNSDGSVIQSAQSDRFRENRSERACSARSPSISRSMSRSSLNPPMSPSERPCLLSCAPSGRDLRFDRLLLIPAPPTAWDPFNREEPVTYGYDVYAADAHR